MAQTSLQSLLMQQFSASGKTGALNSGSASNSTFSPGSSDKGGDFARTLESRLDVQRDRGPTPAPSPSPTPQQASRPVDRPAEPPKSGENAASRKPQERARNEKSEASHSPAERIEQRRSDTKGADTAATDKAQSEGNDARSHPPANGTADETTAQGMPPEQHQDNEAPKDEASSSDIAANLGLAGLPAALAAALERLSPNAAAGDALNGTATGSEPGAASPLSLDLTQAGGAPAQASHSDPALMQTDPALAQTTAGSLQAQTQPAATTDTSPTGDALPAELTLPGEESASRLLAQRERGDASLLPDSASTVAKAVREAISEFTGQRDSSQQGWGGQPQNQLNFAAQLAARNGEANGPKFADLATAPIAGTDAGITDGSAPIQGLPHPLLNPRGESATRPAPVMHMNTAAFESGWAEEVGSKVGLLFRAEENRAELVLNPAKLGRIEITLTLNGEQATAQFLAATPAAREALEQAMPRLREVLQQAGIMLADSQVDTSSQQQAQQEQQARQGRRQHGDEGLPLDEPLIRAGNVWIRPGEGRVDIFA